MEDVLDVFERAPVGEILVHLVFGLFVVRERVEFHFEVAGFILDFFNVTLYELVFGLLLEDVFIDVENSKEVWEFFFLWFGCGPFGNEFLEFLDQLVSLVK